MTAGRGVPTLVGQRCTLRALRPSDAPSIARHANDPLVWRNLFDGFPHPYTLGDAEWWCGSGHQERSEHVWAITVPADGNDEAIGCCSVMPQSGWMRCNAEVGYWIGQAYWRRGITGEALTLISDWAFTNLRQVTRLFAPIFGWNEGSQAVARHAGYALEGRMPCSAIKGGVVIDRVVYARYRPGAEGRVPALPTTDGDCA